MRLKTEKRHALQRPMINRLPRERNFLSFSILLARKCESGEERGYNNPHLDQYQDRH